MAEASSTAAIAAAPPLPNWRVDEIASLTGRREWSSRAPPPAAAAAASAAAASARARRNARAHVLSP